MCKRMAVNACTCTNLAHLNNLLQNFFQHFITYHRDICENHYYKYLSLPMIKELYMESLCNHLLNNAMTPTVHTTFVFTVNNQLQHT